MAYTMQAQKRDPYKNKGLFNITKYTHYRVSVARLKNVSEYITNVPNIKNQYGNGLQVINGYFINPKFSLGVGVGLEYFNPDYSDTFPIFLDMRYYLKDAYNSFYAYGDIGGLANLGGSFSTGTMLGGGIGYKFFINSRKTIVLLTDAGYYHRSIDINYSSNPRKSSLIINGFAFSIGVLF